MRPSAARATRASCLEMEVTSDTVPHSLPSDKALRVRNPIAVILRQNYAGVNPLPAGKANSILALSNSRATPFAQPPIGWA
jgi:hypothetical protein